MIFGKRNKGENGPQKEEILQHIHDLGFEVGYFHHSEDGWVYRKHQELLSLSKAHDSIYFEGCYEAAKQEGREHRRQDIAKGLSTKSEPNSKPREHLKVTFTHKKEKSSEKIESKNGVGPIKINKLVDRPGAVSKPNTIKKGTVLKAPKFLR